MSALKRWRTLGGGGGGRFFFKFTLENPTLEGIWRGSEPNKFNGENGMIELPDGRVAVFTLNTALKDLHQVPLGTQVRVTFLGLQRAKNGNMFNAFQVQVPEDAEVDETGDSSEVPF